MRICGTFSEQGFDAKSPDRKSFFSGRYEIMDDSEIYNRKELQKELCSAGYKFSGETDAEIIVAAYVQWGSECLERFNGVWAFALFDRFTNRFFLARDRFGVKSLYYAKTNKKYIFASEIRDLLSAGNLPRRVNLPLVYDFLTQGLLEHTPQTMFEGIYVLPAGCYAFLGSGGGFAPIRYYDIKFSDEIGQTLTERQRSEFLARFETAVRLREDGCENLGACLSGGLDSSAIVCAMKNISENGLVFSSVPDDKRVDESEYINAVLKYTGVRQIKIVPDGKGLARDIEALALCQEQPFASAGIYASYSVMRAARENGADVLMDGQGADEILCGYRKSRIYYIKKLLREKKALTAAKEMLLSVSQIKTSMNVSRDLDKLMRILGRNGEKNIFHKYLGGRLINETGFDYDRSRDFQHNDVFVNSLPALLRYAERNAAANGIKMRTPFLDHNLVGFCAALPLAAKLSNGYSKAVLRYSVDLPEKVRKRKTKIGFGAPEDTWIRENSEYFKSLFTDNCKSAGLIDEQRLLQDFDALAAGKPDIGLWRYISLELWMRAFDVE